VKRRKEKSKSSVNCKRKPLIDKLILTLSEPREHSKKARETLEREKCLRMKREEDCWLKWKLLEKFNSKRENTIFRTR